jgi:hypothetical protein
MTSPELAAIQDARTLLQAGWLPGRRGRWVDPNDPGRSLPMPDALAAAQVRRHLAPLYAVGWRTEGQPEGRPEGGAEGAEPALLRDPSPEPGQAPVCPLPEALLRQAKRDAATAIAAASEGLSGILREQREAEEHHRKPRQARKEARHAGG